ncbi:cAMP-dependent protein kinase regulatory subunit [Aspergillus terreus NIH2624]|uniref:cAMP-dependent protein kinase regulatory subunit n=1 Tax=Aspergillus terreus (strain NIH 2624 / FGSC A1156) TaxID=341663 RepID=Q0CP60_ASPTN|nr:cAMP-dependent protein kinase regulatory subunit [Aspergillus terreus NIH2624]EAU34971.1 cAMP-dependent protein kinase regulatory subunit [Aspergillus terreus NIH2624]
MAQSSFPGTNPFLKIGTKDDKSSFQKISEEDEYEVTSPTDPTFRTANAAPSSSGENAASGEPTFTEVGGQIRMASPAREDPVLRVAWIPAFRTTTPWGRRTSVSAESLNPTSAGADSWVPPYHAKTTDQLSRLKTAVSGNFLFSHLDDDQFKTVLDALGDAGDYFYVVEDGHFDVYIHPSGSVQPGADGMGNKIGSIGPGGSFGELALMYNAPRAATIVSTDPKSTLWALDRITFRRILMDSAFQRRRMYEAFLEEVPLLSSLQPYERSKIADALEPIKYPSGSTIITEGDPGDAFYLLESGEAEAFKEGVEGNVKSYKRGDFFGELALLDDKPRAASVVAKTDVKVARLGRDGFKRLLGPVEDIMRRADYQTKPAAA